MKKAIARLLLAALVLALAFGCADRNQEEPEGLYLWFPVNPALWVWGLSPPSWRTRTADR